MKLTQEEVHHLSAIVTPLDRKNDPHIDVRGVFVDFAMRKDKLSEVEPYVRHMLEQLKPGLETEAGLPVYDLHERKDGKVWTMHTEFVEVLVALALATGLIEPATPRDTWSPGNMARFRYVNRK